MKPTDKITFRLSSRVANQLFSESKAQGLSPHLLARSLIEDRLALKDLETAIQAQAQEIATLYEEQQHITAELKALRAGLVAAFEVLFVRLARITPEEAQEWLNNAFSQE